MVCELRTVVRDELFSAGATEKLYVPHMTNVILYKLHTLIVTKLQLQRKSAASMITNYALCRALCHPHLGLTLLIPSSTSLKRC